MWTLEDQAWQMMMDPDVLRKLTQLFHLQGVGTTTNRVSPGTLQEILDSRDQSLIDQALDQLTADYLTAYLESLPSPPPPTGSAVSPTGVGSQASRTPSKGVRTPHRGSPLLSSGARTLHSGSPRFSPGGLGRTSTPRGRPRRGRGRPCHPQPSPSLP